VGNGLTFRRDLVSLEDIRAGVNALADSVGVRLRVVNMKCSTVQVTIKDTKLKAIQRQKATSAPTFISSELAKTALEIIKAEWAIGKPIRMLTITAQNLLPADIALSQFSLFDEDNSARQDKKEQLEKAVDAIRGKFGDKSVRRGAPNEDLGIK
jgi:DNA polymerase-4